MAKDMSLNKDFSNQLQSNSDVIQVTQPIQSKAPIEDQHSNQVNKTMSELIQKINSPQWNDKGLVIPFLSFGKVPHGILELRKAVKKPKRSSRELLAELKRIAQYRLDHYPLFTKRDVEVADFYYQITQISIHTPYLN